MAYKPLTTEFSPADHGPPKGRPGAVYPAAAAPAPNVQRRATTGRRLSGPNRRQTMSGPGGGDFARTWRIQG